MPFFPRKEIIDADGYRKLNVSAADIAAEQLTRLKVGGQVVLFARLRGELHAFSNVCPHAAADLSQGRYARGQIKCPDHSYTFDVRTGRAVWPEDEVCRLKRFPVKDNGDAIWIKLA